MGVAAWFWLSISLVYHYYNTIFDANQCLASILAVGFIWNNEARCIQINGEKVFFMKPQGLVAQDILTKSLQQLYNCHNKVKSEVQAKLISLQINLVLKSMLGPRKGF